MGTIGELSVGVNTLQPPGQVFLSNSRAQKPVFLGKSRASFPPRSPDLVLDRGERDKILDRLGRKARKVLANRAYLAIIFVFEPSCDKSLSLPSGWLWQRVQSPLLRTMNKVLGGRCRLIGWSGRADGRGVTTELAGLAWKRSPAQHDRRPTGRPCHTGSCFHTKGTR